MAACCVSECVNGMSWLRNAKLSSVHLLIPSSFMLAWPQKYLFLFQVFNIFHILNSLLLWITDLSGTLWFRAPFTHNEFQNSWALNAAGCAAAQKASWKWDFCVDKALILIMTNCFSRIQHYSYSCLFCYWSKIIYMPENHFFLTFTLFPLCTSFYIF